MKWLFGLTAALLAWRFWLLPNLGISLYIDEAQYWTWAQHLDWGYFSKPPGVATLIWLSTALFGDGMVGVKALSMLCYPLAAAACWGIARRLYDERVAFWSAIAVLTLPIFSWLGLFVSTDALLTLFWAMALLAFLRALDSDSWADWLLLGSSAASACFPNTPWRPGSARPSCSCSPFIGHDWPRPSPGWRSAWRS
ncbi:MAG: glycosyltransferase family 39 protein [Betaproteobacteria bacterium]|nr:glycosyltransferase family 39 protein [Betaproteobacteria bacterium]